MRPMRSSVAASARHERTVRPLLTGSVGTAFSEDADFDELDDLGHRSGRDRFGRPVRRSFLSTGRQRAVAGILAALVVIVGTRGFLLGAFPTVGQMAPLLPWSASWHHFFAGWQPAGVGTTAPATPAFGIVGLAGTVLLGAMGLTQKVLLLGCLPLGAWGMSRLMRPLVSPRARVVAAICYARAAPAVRGHWPLVGGTAWWPMPPFPSSWPAWRAPAGMAPFDRCRRVAGGGPPPWGRRRCSAPSSRRHVLCPGRAADDARPKRRCRRGLGHGGATAACGAHHLGSGQGRRCGRRALFALDRRHSPGRQGCRRDLWPAHLSRGRARLGRNHAIRYRTHASFAHRMAPGGGGGPATSPREGRAARVGRPVVGHGMRLVGARLRRRHTAGPGRFAPSEAVVLVPAAIAVAAGIGLGISSFENDLVGLAFGWRQLVSGLALAAVTVGLLPVFAGAANGRWGLPANWGRAATELPYAEPNPRVPTGPCGWGIPGPFRSAGGLSSPACRTPSRTKSSRTRATSGRPPDPGRPPWCRKPSDSPSRATPSIWVSSLPHRACSTS